MFVIFGWILRKIDIRTLNIMHFAEADRVGEELDLRNTTALKFHWPVISNSIHTFLWRKYFENIILWYYKTSLLCPC